MAYTGKLRPKGVPFWGLFQIYERVGKSVISVYKQSKLTDALLLWKSGEDV